MRPYRWQDPAPAAVKAIRNRVYWIERRRNPVEYEPETIALPVRDMSEPKAKSCGHLRTGENVCKQCHQCLIDAGKHSCPVCESSVPTMTIDGVEYVEAPETVDANACSGCAFAGMRDCDKPRRIASHCFGNFCDERHVIYIRKA